MNDSRSFPHISHPAIRVILDGRVAPPHTAAAATLLEAAGAIARESMVYAMTGIDRRFANTLMGLSIDAIHAATHYYNGFEVDGFSRGRELLRDWCGMATWLVGMPELSDRDRGQRIARGIAVAEVMNAPYGKARVGSDGEVRSQHQPMIEQRLLLVEQFINNLAASTAPIESRVTGCAKVWWQERANLKLAGGTSDHNKRLGDDNGEL